MAAGILLAVITGAVVFARIRFHGQNLARFIEHTINDGIRGRVSVARVEWPLSRLPGAIVGGWLPVDIDGVEVFDERGILVIKAPHVRAEIHLLSLASGPDFRIRHIVVDPGGYALLERIHPAGTRDGDEAVSLVAAFRSRPEPNLRAGHTAKSSSMFDLRDYRVEDASLDFHFGAFRAHASGVSTSGALKANPRDPLAERLYFSLAPTARDARIAVGPLETDLHDVTVERLADVAGHWPTSTEPTGLRFDATAAIPGGGQAVVHGAIRGSDDAKTLDIRLDVDHAGTLARKLAPQLGGQDARATVTVTGPTDAPSVAARVEHLAIDTVLGGQPATVTLQEARAHWVSALDEVVVDDEVALEVAVTAAGDPVVMHGRGTVDAHLSLAPLGFSVDVDIPSPIDLSPVVTDPRVHRIVGPIAIAGRVRGYGDALHQVVSDAELALGDLKVRANGEHRADGTIDVASAQLTLDRSRVDVTGHIDGRRRTFDLEASGRVRDLGRILRALGARPVASAASASPHHPVRIRGSFDDPEVTAPIAVSGLPVVGSASARIGYHDDTVTIDGAHTGALGGSIDARGRILLGGTPRIARAHASARGVDLSRLPVVGSLFTGHASADLEAHGPANEPTARVGVDLHDWTLAGESYDDTRIEASAEDDGSKNVTAHLVRKLGGQLDLAAFLDELGQLGGVVSVRQLPLETLSAVRSGHEPNLGATVDAELQLAGSTDQPTADGIVTLAGTWFRQSFLGGANLDLVSLPDGRLGFSGRFFQDSVVINGALSTSYPFAFELEADVRRVELDRFWPELRALWSSRAWASGKLTYRGTLVPLKDRPRHIELELTEAMLIVDNESMEGRPAPVRLRSTSALVAEIVGDELTLKQPVTVEGPAGSFTISGGGTPQALNLGIDGTVAVQLLQPYFRDDFDELGGEVRAHATLMGTLAKPRVTGTLIIKNLAMRPAGQDTTVGVPNGKIQFDNDQLSLTGLSMVVEDEFSAERSELHISGGVKLANFEPRLWAIQIDGQLAGKMLLVVAPEVFSSARGVAELSIALSGPGRTPDIDGRLEFSPDNPLTLVPRSLRREISLTDGAMAFTEQLVEIDDVRGWLDDEGRITSLSGEVGLEDWRPVDGCVSVNARDIPFRVPKRLELDLNIQGLSVCGDRNEGLEIGGGRIEIVDGRYIERWKQAVDFLRPERTVETGPGILETEPLLANARLDGVRVSTRAFFVKNNIANLELSGDLTITGTPAKPRLDGLVRVERGTFKIQGLRPKFTRTTGSLWFSKLKEFPEQSPRVEVRSESDFRATTGQDYLIILELSGPISNLQLDLRTASGLQKADVLNLIVVGRTVADTRKALGDSPVAKVGEYNGLRTTEEIDSGGLAVADELAKSLSSDLLSSLLADPIRNLTHIDVVKLSLGATGSIDIYLEEGFTRSVRGIGEYERSSRGSTFSGQVQYRITDHISGDYEYLRKQYDDDAEVDVNRQRLKFTYRLPIIP